MTRCWTNVTLSFASARCIWWLTIAQITVSWRCVIDVMLLDCVSYKGLIRTRIIVCSVRVRTPAFEQTGLEHQNTLTRVRHFRAAAVAHPLEFEVTRVRTSQLICKVFPSIPRLVCGITSFPTLCLTPERWIGLRVQSTVSSFPELCFSVFRGVSACGVEEAIFKNVVFPTCSWILDLIIIL